MTNTVAQRQPMVGIAKGAVSYDLDHVRQLVREALLQTGLGRTDPERPLADIVEPGMTVLLKPNWVATENKSAGSGSLCLYTQPEVVIAVLEELGRVAPQRIILGDAPLQRTDFHAFLTDSLKSAMDAAGGELVDFRSVAMRDEKQQQNLRPPEEQVLFDLGSDSWLEEICCQHHDFRVTVYDPEKLAANHAVGRHRYLVCREVIDSDLVINLPKLKTHCKVGLTCCLKNLVGIVSDKGYLPHHRRGGSHIGGDCYEGFCPRADRAEGLLDAANRSLGNDDYVHKRTLAAAAMPDTQLEGAWIGNDTCWRMVRDLNTIVRYGCADGTISHQPQRQIWSITDAIIAGQGNGPLAPAPLNLGVVSCTNDALAGDRTYARLLNLDPERIPLLRSSGKPTDRAKVFYDHVPMSSLAVARLGLRARPPDNWQAIQVVAAVSNSTALREVWIHPDKGQGHNWYQRLAFSVAAAGLTPHLFRSAGEVPNEDGVATFLHMRHAPAHRQSDKRIMKELAQKDRLRLVPSYAEAQLYDDKLAQTELFTSWLPRTYVCRSSLEAEAALAQLSLPFVSKSSDGAGSANVRLVSTVAAAREEMRGALREDGIETYFGHRQQGYLIWQAFCPGNQNDWRVIVIGRRYAAVLIRNNREDVPFASGSGLLNPVAELDDSICDFLDTGLAIAEQFQFDFCGLDLVRADDGQIVLLESTTSWSMRCYQECQWFAHSDGHWFPTGKFGYDMFELIVKWLLTDESSIQLA